MKRAQQEKGNRKKSDRSTAGSRRRPRAEASRSLSGQQSPKRVHVTIPEEVEGLFRWYLKYAPEFEGKAAAIVAHSFRAGIEEEYGRAIQNAEPLEGARRLFS